MDETKNLSSQIPESYISRVFFADTRLGLIWLVIRLYVGWQWWEAGWSKLHNPVWVGAKSGAALQGFLAGALQKTAGAHPDVQGWYAYFLNGFVEKHLTLFSYLVTYGELAVGIALILGIFTGIAAFFGAFMNFNYLFAGTVSVNPLLLLLQLFLILAWRAAGWIGVDRYLLPVLGAAWQKRKFFKS